MVAVVLTMGGPFVFVLDIPDLEVQLRVLVGLGAAWHMLRVTGATRPYAL